MSTIQRLDLIAYFGGGSFITRIVDYHLAPIAGKSKGDGSKGNMNSGSSLTEASSVYLPIPRLAPVTREQ